MSEFEEFLTLREVKTILAVSPGVVIRMVQSGEIPAYKVTGSTVRREEVSLVHDQATSWGMDRCS
jgi:excisionase family DNA binding protein